MKREVILEPEAQAVPGGPLSGCDGTVLQCILPGSNGCFRGMN